MRTSTLSACTIILGFTIGCDATAEREGEGESAYIAAREASTSALIASVRLAMAENDVGPIAAAPVVRDELFELGQSLAFDKLLSGNLDVSCMTCHHPEAGSDDDRHLSLGVGGSGLGADRKGGFVISRNAPALFNLHEFDTMFWDSRVSLAANGSLRTPAGEQLTPAMEDVLEFGVVSAQAMFPVTSGHEMRGSAGENELADLADNDFTGIWSGLMARIGEVPEYVTMFEAAYPGTSFEDMSFAHAANAIAAFEIRGFAANDSPWQDFVNGNDEALSKDALRGAATFFESGCASCHSGPMFSDFEHHNTLLAQFGPGKGHGPTGTDDFGREGVTGDASDRYAFRTGTLVNIELTGPYGHDGQHGTLKQSLLHYSDLEGTLLKYEITKHVRDRDLWRMQLDNSADVVASPSPALADLSLASRDVDALEIFLKSLTSESSRNLSALVPDSVPSGLPVAD